MEKKRKVLLVKWFEPYSETENVNKFLVVYDDGSIYVFYTNQDSKAEKERDSIDIKIGGQKKEVLRAKVIAWMQ